MNVVTFKNDTIEIEIKGLDKLWSLKSKLKIPCYKIKRVYIRPKELKPPWLRVAGTDIPKVIIAGTYYGKGRKEFWCTHFRKDCIVFDIEDFNYTRVVIDVEHPNEIIAKLSNWFGV